MATNHNQVSITDNDDLGQTGANPLLRSRTTNDTQPSSPTCSSLPAVSISSTTSPLPSWRRRAQYREQLTASSFALTASFARHASPPPTFGIAGQTSAPHVQRHFTTPGTSQEVLAARSTLESQAFTSSSTTQALSGISLTSSPALQRHPSNDSPSSLLGVEKSDRAPPSKDSPSTFNTNSGGVTSSITRTSDVCDNTSRATTNAMLSPAALFTANINIVPTSSAPATAHQTPNDAHNKTKKSKGVGSMLSAWSRKKSKGLPTAHGASKDLLTANSDSIAQSQVSSPQSQWTSSIGSPANTSVTSPQLNTSCSASVVSSEELSIPKPRSGKSEQAENINDLCDFLDEQRMLPSDLAATATPELKSFFEWGSSDEDEKSSKVRKVSIPTFRKHTRAAAAVDSSNTEIPKMREEAEKAEQAMKKLGALLSPDSPGGSRANAFAEQPALLELASPSPKPPVSIGKGNVKAGHVTSPLPAHIKFSREAAANKNKRSSVNIRLDELLGEFIDPIWSPRSVTGIDFRVGEFCDLKQGLESYSHAKAQVEPSRLSTSVSMPSLTASPDKNDDRTALDDNNISPRRHFHGIRVRTGPITHDLSSGGSPTMVRRQTSGSIRKSLGPRKIKSVPTLNERPQVRRRHTDNKTAPPPTFRNPIPGRVDTPHTPRTPSRLRHGLGAQQNTPFHDGLHKGSALTEPRPSVSTDTSAMMEETAHGLKLARTRSSSPTLGVTPSPSAPSFSHNVPTTPSQRPKKLEKLKQPDSEDAKLDRLVVEATRPTIRKKLRLPAQEQKRQNRIKAGREAIERGTQLGLEMIKPFGSISEDEFEALGIAATNSQKGSSASKKGALLSSFFKPPLGASQVVKAEGNAVCGDTSDEKVLRATSDEEVDDALWPSTAAREHFEEALKLLGGDGGGDDGGVNHVDRAFAPVGLGITSGPRDDTVKQSPTTQRGLEFAGSTLQSSSVVHTLRPITEVDVESLTTTHGPDNEDAHSISSLYSVDNLQPVQAHGSRDAEAAEHDTAPFTCEDAIPLPLKVQKRKPPPLTIPVLVVDRSSKDVQLEKSPVFSPRRDSSFMRKIRAVGQAHQTRLGSHPAMRSTSASEFEVSSPIIEGTRSRSGSNPKLARVDSGIVTDTPALDSEVHRHDAVSQHSSQHTLVNSPTSYSLGQRTSASSTDASDSTRSRLSGKVDMQKLRSDMDLEPLQLPVGIDSQRHPHHPFTWDHEKVMCRTIHNTRNVEPQLPEVPKNQAVNLRNVNSVYFDKGEPTDNYMEKVKRCAICSKLCCRYADLVLASKTDSQDLTETAKRIKAQNRVSLLRSAYPTGIEEYETFLDCGQCGKKVCPGCASRCRDDLCKDIYCYECGQGLDSCPVHNFF